MTIQLKRGTRARVNLTASQRGFLTGEPLLITDENRLAVATSPSTYTTFLKEGEGGGGTTDIAATTHAAGTKTTPVDTDEFPLVDSASSWGLKKLTFANLKTWIGGLFVSKSGDTMTGNLNFSGNGRRITGDFSNGTLANRITFQTSTTNGATSMQVTPNGTGNQTQYILFTDSATANGPFGDLTLNTGVFRFRTGLIGGIGAAVPMTFDVNGSERLRIDTSGTVLATSGALGYGTGAGGTVTQATSKTTAVTLNKPSGKITMNNAALAGGASVVFVVNNTFAQNNDLVVAHTDSTGGFTLDVYRVEARASVNAFAIKVTNTSGASLSEAVVINFAIIKGSAS